MFTFILRFVVVRVSVKGGRRRRRRRRRGSLVIPDHRQCRLLFCKGKRPEKILS